MAKKVPGEKGYNEELVPCERNCGTWVQRKLQGRPHQASKTVNGELVYFNCATN